MAKALFGAEVVILLFLGLSVGVLLFMYVNVKTDLYKVEMNNQVLHKDVMEYVSNTKTSLYKKDLAESDLKRFRDVNKNDEEKIEELTHQLKMLQLQLEQTKAEYISAIRNQTMMMTEKDERQGIEEHLAETVTECSEKLGKCERRKITTLKAIALNTKKLKDATTKVALAEAKEMALELRIVACEDFAKKNCPLNQHVVDQNPQSLAVQAAPSAKVAKPSVIVHHPVRVIK